MGETMQGPHPSQVYMYIHVDMVHIICTCTCIVPYTRQVVYSTNTWHNNVTYSMCSLIYMAYRYSVVFLNSIIELSLTLYYGKSITHICASAQTYMYYQHNISFPTKQHSLYQNCFYDTHFVPAPSTYSKCQDVHVPIRAHRHRNC